VDRVELTSPLGRGTVRVAADRVDRYKANGWVEKPKPKPQRRRKSDADGEE